MLQITLIEDNSDYRLGLKAEIDLQDDMCCISDFGSIPSALNGFSENASPDILILDLGLPKVDGLDAIPQLQERLPQTKILVLTISEDRSRVIQALAKGAKGYLLKTGQPDKVIEGIRNISRGEMPMSPAIAEIVLRCFEEMAPSKSISVDMTERELDVLKALADGKSRKLVADEFGLSTHTINHHVRNIYEKLEVHNLSGALKKAAKGGLI